MIGRTRQAAHTDPSSQWNARTEALLVTEMTIDDRKAARLRRMIAEAENIRDGADLELARGCQDGSQYFRLFTISVAQAARRRALIDVWELVAGESWKG